MTSHLIVTLSIYAAIWLLGISIVASIAAYFRTARAALFLYLLSCLVFYGTRAYLKEFFPFTDKIESFVVLSVLLVVCALIYRNRISSKEFITLQALALAAASVIFIFVDVIRYPPMFLHTIWYPLHIPVSFRDSHEDIRTVRNDLDNLPAAFGIPSQWPTNPWQQMAAERTLDELMQDYRPRLLDPVYAVSASKLLLELQVPSSLPAALNNVCRSLARQVLERIDIVSE